MGIENAEDKEVEAVAAVEAGNPDEGTQAESGVVASVVASDQTEGGLAASGVASDHVASDHAASDRTEGGRFEGRDSRDGRGRRGRDRDRGRDREPVEKEFVEKLVKLNRTAKVVKGGRRFSFSALTVIGDRKGKVGYGFGKANDVSEAIRKSIDKAKRNMVMLPVKNGTIPHEVTGFFKASRVLLKPACSGTGIIAGGPVRAIMEAGGVTDVLSKSIGAASQYNVVKATFNCISKMMDARTVSRNRGKSLNELWG
jgi:small subunit ribosomal protein S5